MVLTLTIEPADYQEAVQKDLKQIRQKANIPGFRPGMVPAGLVKKMYGKGVLADVLNKVVGEQLSKYIEDNKLQVLGDPLPNNEQTPEMDLDNQDTFTFAFDIAVAPEFDAKLNGHNKLTHYNIEVTDEDLEKQYEEMAKAYGMEAEQVKKFIPAEGLKKDVASQKAIDLVRDTAVVAEA